MGKEVVAGTSGCGDTKEVVAVVVVAVKQV